MPRVTASRELLASRDDVWQFIAEPRHFADWWPGIATVQPDRRGLAEGARWQVARGGEVGLLRRPESEGVLVITAVEPERRLVWRDIQQQFTAEILLEPGSDGTTRATLTIEASPWRAVLEGLRPLPRKALARLHALCQTAATL